MDTTPIYELRERLRAAVMAGTNLLSEDFRLKRAYEAFRPLEAASPVFAKVGQLTGQLLSPDCQNPQGVLLDAITLADAVICTLGTVDVAGEVNFTEAINVDVNVGNLIVNAPYSVLKELLEALTTSGGGHYGYVCDMHDNHPELFQDYRVKYTLVQALGASYSELADQVEQWLIEDDDRTILPALYQNFDPKGRKEMVRRVRVISALAGAGANDFYVKMLDEAQKDVRTELIDALRHDPQNVSLLFDLSKTEKGKNKDKVFELLAAAETKEASDYFKELAGKKPDSVLKYLKNSTTDWAAGLVADLCGQTLAKMETIDSAPDGEKQALLHRLQDIVRALFGKGGACICECYRKLLSQKEKINRLDREIRQHGAREPWLRYGVLCYDSGGRTWQQLTRYLHDLEAKDTEALLGKILHHSLIVNPDPDLQALALELYHGKDVKKSNITFLPAAATVKIAGDEDCMDWLEEQVTEKNMLRVSKLLKDRLKVVIEAAAYVKWNHKKNSYEFYGSFIDAPEYRGAERLIKLPHAKEIMEWLKKHSSKVVDELLAQWVPLNDEGMRQMMGEYFYTKALITDVSYDYLESMKLCGWTVCKGLGVRFIKQKQDIPAYALSRWMMDLPGSREAVMEETRTICRMLRGGELKVKNLNVEEFEKYMDEWR